MFSGNYNDLSDKPTLFDGNYNNLSNKPTIPTSTSQLTNDSGFVTATNHNHDGAYVSKSTYETDQATQSVTNSGLSGRIGDVEDQMALLAKNKANKSEVYTKTEIDNKGFLVSEDLPTKTSDLVNDSGYITKAVSPTELNSRFAISNSATDLTANLSSTQITSANTAYRIRGIAYGVDKFVAVNQGGIIQYSTDNGASWTAIPQFTTNAITSVTYGKGVFVCIDYINSGGGNVYKSTDGINWELTTTLTDSLENIVYANGRFVVVGNGGLVTFSDDLVTFTRANTGTTNALIGITYGQDKYVAVSSAGQLIYSVDGIH